MRKEVFYLGNCTTCKRIMAEVGVDGSFRQQEIKSDKITAEQLKEMAQMAGSYEKLFSRVAMKYRALGLNEMDLSEKEYRKYILEEYTFLKRPVFILGEEIFIGNSKKNVAAVKAALEQN